MTGINFNNSEEFISDLSIFNEGESGIVENVTLRIEKKGADGEEKHPVYKLIAKDKHGELNEGFFYYQNMDDKGFKNYQGQRLIMVARGVLGDDVQFPIYNTPKEALDGIMIMVAKACKGKFFRTAVCYGTTKKPDSYLRFKSFGRFIESMDVSPSKLKLENTDNTVRKEVKPTPEAELIQEIGQIVEGDISSVPKSEETDDLPF